MSNGKLLTTTITASSNESTQDDHVFSMILDQKQHSHLVKVCKKLRMSRSSYVRLLVMKEMENNPAWKQHNANNSKHLPNQ